MADKSDDAKADDAKGGGKKKLIMIVVPVLLVVVGAAVYFLMLKPSATEAAAGTTVAAAEEPKPEPSFVEGAVIPLEPISINLANGHFLKLGLSLQATADAGEEVTGAKALDAAIELFSQKTMDELATREGREKAKAKLAKRLMDLYEDKVYEVYFTEFVMQ